ncbi:MICOS complex subunit MIC27 [Tachysurus fulvidraco]|uniref:MICOS complex subunit MIC27 n=1 Tax=Tachysurus fulvidraco TaxID=1234273 RepID=UPI001FEE8A98|nr:MICOS complex subunit MIC27 [Tachysurus fulvidraco]
MASPGLRRDRWEGGRANMVAKVVKLAVIPAALGSGSFKVYALTEERTDKQIPPRELSIYNTEPTALQYVEEKAGALQTGFGRMRLGLQRFVQSVQNTCSSVRVGAVSLYQTGHDTYDFLRDPPPGFLPRVGIITVSGLAGLVLARKGSRLKRIGVPLVMTSAATAVCYPLRTVGVLQVTAKTVYAASSLVASAFKSDSKVGGVIPEKSHTSEEDGPGTEVPQTDELPEKVPKGEPASEANVVEGLDISDNLPESAAPPTATAPLVEETTPPLAVEETTPPLAVEETIPPPAIEETTPPPPAVEITTSPTAEEKPRFVPDPSLLDHGQAHPEDSDLYSTRG